MTPEFIKWAKDNKYIVTRDKDNPDIYTNTHTQSAWEAWKASDHCCNHDCKEGRLCPRRNEK